ncbi:Uncharacterised protein [Mycobacterium tuberculosis]|uniref:Uncharacterized protein n=1 Tax=Mycobacterium tuberculosis TaxID=1773 RepID=A0A916LDR1_MYCTX|nr:Uncharacterised protein [Mycobacterium tuberculosis]COY48860.1 Uncharacterised protein [Mycobacterium tuberculosis]
MLVCGPPRSLNLADRSPRSASTSTAITRSPRSRATALPTSTVIVVLPTPPLAETNANLWTSASGAQIR